MVFPKGGRGHRLLTYTHAHICMHIHILHLETAFIVTQNKINEYQYLF